MDSFTPQFFGCALIAVSNFVSVCCEDSTTPVIKDNRNTHLIILSSVLGYLMLVSICAIFVWYCASKPKSNQEQKSEQTADSDLKFTFVTYPEELESCAGALKNYSSVDTDAYVSETDDSSSRIEDGQTVAENETYIQMNNVRVHHDNAGFVEETRL